MGGTDSDLLSQIRDGIEDLPDRLARALAYGPTRPQGSPGQAVPGVPGSTPAAATAGGLGLTFGPEWDAVKGLAGALGAFSPQLGRIAALMGNLERLAGAVDTFGRVFKLFGGSGAEGGGEDGGGPPPPPAAPPPWAIPVPSPQPPPPPAAPPAPAPQPPAGPAPAAPAPSPLSDAEREELGKRFPKQAAEIEAMLRAQAETPEAPQAAPPPPVLTAPPPPAPPPPSAPEPPAGPAPSILSRGLAPEDMPQPPPVPRSLLERPLAPVPPAAPETPPPPAPALPEFSRPEDLTRAPWEVLRSAQAEAQAAGLGTTEANAAGWAASQRVREQGTSPAVVHARELQRHLDAGLPQEEAEGLARAAGDKAFAARTPVPEVAAGPPEVRGLWPAAGEGAAAVPGGPAAEQSAELLETMGDLKDAVAELAKAVKEGGREGRESRATPAAGEKTPERLELPPNAGRAERGASEGPDKNIDFARQLGNVLSTVAEIAGAL